MATALIFVLGLLTSEPTFAAPRTNPAPALPQNAVARAGWLAGCWHMAGERGNPSVRVTWTRASNDLLVGTWIHVPLGLEPEYSFLQIESAPALTLIWQGPGERPVRMPVDSAAARSTDEVAFANSGTGFPKRVVFRRGKGETLLMRAAFEGTKALDSPMKKLNCS